MEPAGLAGTAQSDPDAAHRPDVPVRGADLHSGGAGAHAAVEEDSARAGQHADLRGYV